MKHKLVSTLIFLLVLASALYLLAAKRHAAPPAMPDQPAVSVAAVESPISVAYLRKLTIAADQPVLEETLADGANYTRYIASYLSEGNKIYGLLTVPTTPMPEGGYPAIVFNHGYIPPAQYKTTGSYVAYVDFLARNGFVVFKIDYRGNGKSQGDPSGSYFSSAYTLDALSAVKALQKYAPVNPHRIGMWGHSMAGNLVLRAMLVSQDIKAGVIWAGAVYSYEDFAKYRISDGSYTHRPFDSREGTAQANREISPEIQKIRTSPEEINFADAFWQAISLTHNITYLSAPVQIHHAVNDPVVSVGYSRDLAKALQDGSKTYQLYEYPGGGHNIDSPYFELAMQRTVEFFNRTLI
jgi:dipeptidyl aminopeptidase/acylaminoacyl peptidase